MNCFVSGGSRGIGRAVVLKFIEEGYGCAFSYGRNKEAAEETMRLAKELRPEAVIRDYKMDVKDPTQVETVVEEAIDDFTTIETVVNNAAIVKNNAVAMMSNEEWDEVIAANLSGPFYVIRSFLFHFISNRMGKIINISSLAQDGASGQANYAASKAGLVGLTKTLAREYGQKGITSNIVTVGLVPTDMVKDHLAEKLSKIWMEYCPMKRVGTAEEIAHTVHFLTTEKAGFINGETIRVSGGLTYVP